MTTDTAKKPAERTGARPASKRPCTSAASPCPASPKPAINIDNHATMLAALPESEWPSNLVSYKAAQTEALPHDLPDEDVQPISDYQYRNRIHSLLRTEKIEQGKASRRVFFLDALKAQVSDDYAASVAKREAGRVKRGSHCQSGGIRFFGCLSVGNVAMSSA